MTTNPQGPGSGHEATTAAEVVRSEEQLRVSTRTEVIGRVRVRKVVTSEDVTRSVTLRREELSVEDLPLEAAAGAGADLSGSRAGDDEFEVVLHEERLVVVSVPVERVRVRVHRVTDEVTVSEVLRREQIAFDVAPAVTQDGVPGPGTA